MIAFLVRRFLAILATLGVVTLALYSIAMLTPPETRATLYLPNTNRPLTEDQQKRLIELIIQRHGLDQPFLVQYGGWVGQLLKGEWGYSPSNRLGVLQALIQRTPASAELIFYSILIFIPCGIISGVVAASRKGRRADIFFRLAAFAATSLPPFILALVLLSIFWVALYWFPGGRLSPASATVIASAGFERYTGLVTIDGLLNRRPDVSLDALRHLVLPVITLSLIHWATLGRITRAATLEELGKEYILAARGRGFSAQRVLWRHALGNVMVPALNSSALSAAGLVTGLFVVEVIFVFNGVSSIIINAAKGVPDVIAALGFSIYSVVLVLIIMTLLDIFQVAIDPRLREAEKL